MIREVNRVTVANALLSSRPNASYLEIGVSIGSAFRNVAAVLKIGVDPVFRRPKYLVRAPWAVSRLRPRKPSSVGEALFPLRSDTYFALEPWLVRPEPFDVILIDGLHVADQAYRDITHAIERIAPGGVILVHDCNPQSATAAMPSHAEARRQRDFSGIWNGDTYKAMIRLRADRRDVSAFVLDADQGLGVVTLERSGTCQGF